MAGITIAATRATVINAYTALIGAAALHTADVSTSANELTGTGSARGAVSWGSITDAGGTADHAIVVGTATATLPAAGGSPKGVGLWSATTAGTFRDGQTDMVDVVYPGNGTALITITVTV